MHSVPPISPPAPTPILSARLRLPVLAVSSWFETWFLTLWQERRLRVDGTMVLRRVFGTMERNIKKREQRKFHNKDIIFMTRPFLLKQSNEGG